MRRLFMSWALSTAWLLAGRLDSSSAQSGPASAVPGTSEPTVIVLPSLVARASAPAQSTAPPSPVSNFPVYRRSPANPNEYIVTLSETIVTPVVAKVVQPAPAALPTDTALPPSKSAATFPRAEPAPRRKSYVDLSAAPCFAHAPDYNWIFGQVEYSSVGKEWRLRYASVDEEDRYGGRVSLIENYHVKELREGMYIHVRGHLVNPENTSYGPTYFRIEWYQPVQNPNAEQTAVEQTTVTAR